MMESLRRTKRSSESLLLAVGTPESLLASIVAKFPEVACTVPGESYLFMRTVDEAKKIMQAWDEEALKGGFKAWVEKTPIHVYNASLILSFERTYLLYIHRDP
jgi:hypothetical protein